VELRREQALELPALKTAVLAAAALVILLAATPAAAATAATTATAPMAPVYDAKGNLTGTPFVPAPHTAAQPNLSEEQVKQLALADRKVADWIARYPQGTLTKDATYDPKTQIWTVRVWTPGAAGEIAEVTVTDTTFAITGAWTGPQVAWKMARGYPGAFGRKINDKGIWLLFCCAFLVGLADWRRLRSVRNLDLLVLLSLTASLWFFNRGDIFTAMPLVYPVFAYLLGRMLWIAKRGTATPGRPVWPVWVLVAATVFLVGFRVGLNIRASNVIDVGYSGVIGAERIVSAGESPYGHMPVDDAGKACGLPDSEGYIREHIQTNGRCESANPRGDTYGPVSYLAYVPGYLIFGWSGKWDRLPASHFTAIIWDLLALAGLALVGRRFGGNRLAATLAFSWAAYPFTQYVSSSNTNDAIMPALLIWGFWLLTAPAARGLFLGLGAWTKFAALLLLPLWASYPDALAAPRRKAVFVGGFLLATALGFWVLLLDPTPLHSARVFWDRTFGWQLSRASPFSIWDWGVYRYLDLSAAQDVLKVVLLVGAVAAYFFPRRKNPLQVAALTAALLIGFEIVLTHWFYLYIPWFFPFVAFAVLGPAAVRSPAPAETEPRDREIRQLVPTGG